MRQLPLDGEHGRRDTHAVVRQTLTVAHTKQPQETKDRKLVMHARKLAVVAVYVSVAFAAADWVLGGSQQTPAPRAEGRRGAGTHRHLLYVGSPGSHESENGMGILVFDVRDNFRFVKRITSWDFPASHEPAGAHFGEEVRGIAASPAAGMLYVSTPRRIAAFDLTTEMKVWEQTPGECCDRHAVSPDGKWLYVPSFNGPRRVWYVIEARTGQLIKTLETPDSRGAHNTIFSVDGTRVFMEGVSSRMVSVADTATHTVVRTVGPFTDMVRPFTINGTGTLIFANVNNLLGFEVADVRTGKMLHRVEVAGFGWSGARGPLPHGCPSHGIALSPDEKELWVADGVNGYLHVFDVSSLPPKQKTSVRTKLDPVVGIGWVTFGLDGKYVYAATGDVIDATTKKIVAELKDEFGRPVNSEKMVEIAFANGKPVRASDQFGVGQDRGPSTN